MSRLSKSISLAERKKLQISLIKNTVNSFKNEFVQIYLISKDFEIKELANQIGVSTFNSKSNGLNNEVTEFIELSNSYSSWAICHADLPYLNKYNISVYLQEIAINQIVISKSSDNGTPLIGGCALFENFRYGESSFKKHVLEFEKLNLSYKQVFNKELYFELDTENDYLEFLKNKPRWYKKILD
jgi:2-phospho-L-lactate guanylyltransferase (CobY/MobA/RfbA family)